jgi:lysozyme family protein
MQETFQKLEEEYRLFSSQAKVSSTDRWAASVQVADKLLAKKAHYLTVEALTGVPAVWIMAINERESGGRLDRYLGNGQRLDRVTTLVPKGRGPWSTWDDGCVDGLKYDHVTDPHDWSLEYALYMAERWNGFGPRWHGKTPGYVWAGSSIYHGGKYTETEAGSQWNPGMWDEQLGAWIIMRALCAQDPSLKPQVGWYAGEPAPELTPPLPSPQKPVSTGVPGLMTVYALQAGLNDIMGLNITCDGSIGRETRGAIREFQQAHGLKIDGIAGPRTCAALNALIDGKRPVGKIVAQDNGSHFSLTYLFQWIRKLFKMTK